MKDVVWLQWSTYNLMNFVIYSDSLKLLCGVHMTNCHLWLAALTMRYYMYSIPGSDMHDPSAFIQPRTISYTNSTYCMYNIYESGSVLLRLAYLSLWYLVCRHHQNTIMLWLPPLVSFEVNSGHGCEILLVYMMSMLHKYLNPSYKRFWYQKIASTSRYQHHTLDYSKLKIGNSRITWGIENRHFAKFCNIAVCHLHTYFGKIPHIIMREVIDDTHSMDGSLVVLYKKLLFPIFLCLSISIARNLHTLPPFHQQGNTK